jgi:hypothetical protein
MLGRQSIDGAPCKLAALFDLLFEERLFIERYGMHPDKKEAVVTPKTASQIWDPSCSPQQRPHTGR